MGITETTQFCQETQPTHRSLISQLMEWKYEALSILVAVTSFTGLVVALHEFDGEPQQDWKYAHITRNTMIAAIATVTRTSLLTAVTISISQNKWAWISQRGDKARNLKDLETFDDASRGAKGSLHLLFTTGFRHIASFGALIIVLALAFDTFTQNVLAYEYRDSTLPSTADTAGPIPRSESYGTAYTLNTGELFRMDVPFPMKASISNGVMGLSSALRPPVCSTGNCTWPIVPSLAMCGDCVDVTADLKRHDCPDGHYECTYSLPDGAILHGPRPGISVNELSHGKYTLFNISAINTDALNTTGLYNLQHEADAKKRGRIYAGHFSAIQTSLQEYNPEDSLAATRCDLYFCVQTYNFTINSGKSEIVITANWSMATPYELIDELHTGQDITSLRNFTGIADPSVDPETVYSVTYANARAISHTFSTLTSGSIAYDVARAGYVYGSDGAQGIWQSRHNLSPWIETVASSITAAIRSNVTLADPAGSARRYAGVASQTQAFVRVRWAWILYPSAMLAVGILHFVGTIWQTLHSKVHPWKADPIVPLLLRLDMADGKVGSLDEEGRVPSEVLDLKVVVSRDGKGWCLSTDDY